MSGNQPEPGDGTEPSAHSGSDAAEGQVPDAAGVHPVEPPEDGSSVDGPGLPVEEPKIGAPTDDGPSEPVPEPKLGEEIARSQEKTRSRLAGSLLALLFFMIAVVMVALLFGVPWRRYEGAMTLMFGPVVTALATVLGFYFGEQSKDK
jgi:hypothetical protein